MPIEQKRLQCILIFPVSLEAVESLELLLVVALHVRLQVVASTFIGFRTPEDWTRKHVCSSSRALARSNVTCQIGLLSED